MNLKRIAIGVVVTLVVLVIGFIGLGYYLTNKDSGVPSADVVFSDDDEPVQATAAVQPASAEQLVPVIQASGFRGEVPIAIKIEFALPIATQQQINSDVDKDTRITISPELTGNLNFTGPSTLTFIPEKGFQPGTKYKVRLVSVKAGDKAYTPPTDDAWVKTFTTPAFGFVRVGVRDISRNKRRIKINVVMSGPVKAKDLEQYAGWKIDGNTPLSVRYEDTGRNNIVLASIRAGSVRRGNVDFTLRAGVPMKGKKSISSLAATDSIKLPGGEPMKIVGSRRKEGETGHYIEVTCDDDAAPGKKTYYWGGGRGQKLSRRCVIDDKDAQNMVHFDPPVSFTVTSASRGFRILGDFKRGSYSMTIDGGIRTIDGGVMYKPFDSNYTIPARSARVRFVKKGRYLPRKAWHSLPVSHLNTHKVRLTVRHIRPDNLVYWMTQSDEKATDRVSELLLERDIVLRGTPDSDTTSWLNLGELLPKVEQGVFQVALKSHGKGDTARLLLTDMNLIAKRTEARAGEPYSRKVQVWVIDAHSVKARSGVDMRLITKADRTLATCSTDGNGTCSLSVDEFGIDKSPPFAIIATKGNDISYIKYADLKIGVNNENIAGESYLSAKKYHAAIYSDRGVYRPGDTVHLVGVLRDREHKAPSDSLPVKLKIYDPQNKVLKQVVIATNPAGLVTLDHAFADFASTGQHRVTINVAEKQVGQYKFNVEEFVPERMEVTAKSKKPTYGITETPTINVEAKYLFGGSAKGNQVELTCDLIPWKFKPKENANFAYGIWREKEKAGKLIQLGKVTGTLDTKGNASIDCPSLSKAVGYEGTARLKVQAAVFESGSGRTTNAQTGAPVHPDSFYIGLETNADKGEVGKPFTVKGVVVDWDGKRITKIKQLELEFLRLEAEYGYFYDTQQNRERWQRVLHARSTGSQKITVKDGRFEINLTPATVAAGYIVRAMAGQARTEVKLDGERGHYWWASRSQQVDATPRPLKPTSLDLKLSKTIKVDENVTVKYKAPYKGRVLYTVETNEILISEWQDVEAGETEWEFSLDDFVPNVYVSALLVKDPHLDSKEAFMPDRAFGVKNVRVIPEDYVQKTTLAVPDEIEPGKALTVNIDVPDAEGDTFVTVAAVDEGILSLTRFRSPDPLKSLFFRRSLGIETYETVGWMVLVPPAGPSQRTGGDAGFDKPSRVQAVKPVALWSGVVKVGSNGKAKVTFNVPQYQGQLRIMAVSAGAERIGHAHAKVTVRSPLVAQTTLPRFLSGGDTFEIPVFVTNLTGAKQTITVNMDASSQPMPGVGSSLSPMSPITLTGSSKRRLTLANKASGRVIFKGKATQQVGAATLKVKASAGKFTTVDKLDVPFFPTKPTVRKMQRIELEPETIDLEPYLRGWMPTTENTTFYVTNNPYGDVFGHLRHLIRYPYGCIEQTTSSTRPLLYLPNLLSTVDPGLLRGKGDIGKMTDHGIKRVLSMQTPSGGFSYWPGSTAPNAWGTAYATHMLLDAQKLNYPVPQNRLNDALKYLQQTLNSGAVSTYSYHSQRSTEAYMHYVLALAKRGQKAQMLKLVKETGKSSDGEEAEQRYLLQAGLYLSGDHRYERELKNPDISAISRTRRNSWSFYSDRRRRGFILSVFNDLFGNDSAGEPLAQVVANALRGQRSNYYTTQELSWGITGLGKRVGSKAPDFSPPILRINGKPRKSVQTERQSKGSERTWEIYRASEYGSIKLDASKKGSSKLYLLVNSEGVRTDEEPPTGGTGLTVSRRVLATDGAPVALTGEGHNLGDLLVVEVTITNDTSERIQNIALVDRLPAGWEVENPRLGRSRVIEWIDKSSLWEVDYMNVRDDRVEYFGALERDDSRRVVYMVRAVTAGQFMLPAVAAEAMYDPTVWARQPGRRIRIKAPWSGSPK